MQELSIKALVGMEGQQVLVQDLEYDAPMQVCTVFLEKELVKKPRNKCAEAITKMWLENEEFLFEYEGVKCKNGEFKVYARK